MTGTAKAPFNHTGLTLLLAQRENLRRGQAALPAVVCSSPGHSVQLRCSRPSPGGHCRNISVSCQSNRWEQVTPEHNTPCSKVPALLGHQWITGSFKLGFPQREPNLLVLLTLSSAPSEKELAPRFSPSWPGAPGCHVSGREKCKGKGME